MSVFPWDESQTGHLIAKPNQSTSKEDQVWIICKVTVYCVPDTLGPEGTVLIIEVSSFQGLKMYCGLL
jgi:hypothetical protein